MNISIIIPTYNEADIIAETVRHLRQDDDLFEIIVADGGSTDATVDKAASAGATVIVSPRKGRAAQMNFGARHAKGEILYFLHADSKPPPGFTDKIDQAITSGYHAGCFQLEFDQSHFLLKAYAWFTRFNIDAFRFGDQSLFIRRDTFLEIEGFRDDHIVMEGQEIVRRLKLNFSFILLDDAVVTSARKYRQKGFFKLQLIFMLIFLLYQFGVDQTKLTSLYKKMVQ